MRKWIVKFGSLLLFNIVVLLIIGWLTPAHVGWSAIWAGIVLTAATIWIKPLLTKWFRSSAAKSARQRTKAGEKLVGFFLVLLVAIIVWIVTVLLSGVRVDGFFWGYILPPLILLVAWAIYDAIDDRVEGHADALYGKATRTGAVGTTDAAASVTASPDTAAAQRELQDGLTDEQRQMLDDLGKS